MVGEYRSPKEVVEAYRRGEESSVLTEVERPGGPMLTATSPLRWQGEYVAARPAPDFGTDTEWALADVVGLSHAEIGKLAERGVIRDAREIGRASCRERVCQYV